MICKLWIVQDMVGKHHMMRTFTGGETSDVVTVYGCEGHTVALNCPGAQGLRIVRANYGR